MHGRFPFQQSQQCHTSLRVEKASVAFSRGFPGGLFHVPQWCESIIGLKVEAVQGKQVALEWSETSGGPWQWWHDPGVPLTFPVESACS